MTTDDAQAALLRSLEDGGVDPAHPVARRVWEAFVSFAQVPVEDVEDGLLYEVGIYGFGAPETFQLDLVRQFSFYVDGEYDRMEQLHCTMHWEPDDQLRAIGAFNTWREPHPSFDAWRIAVEGRPEWALLPEGTSPRLDIHQEEV